MPALLLVSGVGWLVLIGSGTGLDMPQFCRGLIGRRPIIDGSALAFTLSLNPLARVASATAPMLLAMMPPLLAQPLAHVWTRSLSRRRIRAIGLFAAAYALVWLAAGMALMMSAIIIETVARMAGAPALVAAAALAGLWQIAPAKQAALNRCHHRPRLAAFGASADRDCLGYGFAAALWCVGACWALMLAPMVAGEAGWPLLPLAALAILVERQSPARAPRWRLPMLAA